jgi:hypothetical protein
MIFIPIVIVVIFAIAFGSSTPTCRRGRRKSYRISRTKSYKRSGGVMCGPGGSRPRGKKFRMT